MMGEQTGAQEALFYGFSIEGHVPSDHMLRSIDRFVVLLIMAPSTQELEPPTIPGRFKLLPRVHLVIISLWVYPMLIILVIGTWRHVHRTKVHGTDKSWSDFSQLQGYPSLS